MLLNPFKLNIYKRIITNKVYNKEDFLYQKTDKYDSELFNLSLSFNDGERVYDIGDVYYDNFTNELYIFSLLKKSNNNFIEGVGFKKIKELETSNRIGFVDWLFLKDVYLKDLKFITNIFCNDEHKHTLLKKYIKLINENISNMALIEINETINLFEKEQFNFYVKFNDLKKNFNFRILKEKEDFLLENYDTCISVYQQLPYILKNDKESKKLYSNFYTENIIIFNKDIKDYDSLLTTVSPLGECIYLTDKDNGFKIITLPSTFNSDNCKSIHLGKRNTEDDEELYHNEYLKII